MTENEENKIPKGLPGTPYPSINSTEEIEKTALNKENSQNINLENEILVLKEIKEKIIKVPAEYIILKGAYFGDLTVSSKYLIFSSTPQKKRPDDQPYKFGAIVFSFIY